MIDHGIEVKPLAFLEAEGEEYSSLEVHHLVGLIVGGVEERVARDFGDVEQFFGVDYLVDSYVQG